ncbi:hypothetical protein C357_19376 [Citreicella sp. 357]|nr:hypothetical protein C357_19376 [Citreicella sp. 357]
MGQIVIQTPSVEARNGLRVDRKALPRRGFPGADIFVKLLDIGRRWGGRYDSASTERASTRCAIPRAGLRR